ncbi:MAG: VOC family protein [Trueperaceae bacterium]|nr:VOC family protein [Trueperaceae bacterium]
MTDRSDPTALIAFRPVADLAASRDFYHRDLGLELTRDQGACLIFRVGDGGYLGLCQAGYDGRDGTLPVDDRLITTLLVDDVEAVHERLLRLGVDVDGPPRRNERFGITQFFARDPDGYRVEVQRFDEPLS